MAALRILIVDDHSLFAKTLEALLAGDPRFEIVGFADDGLEALRLAAATSPEIVLMDIEMPQLDGLAATRRMTELGLGASVIVLTASHDPAHATAALDAGAAAYLTKDRVAAALVPTIESVAAARDSLSADGGAELAGRARVG